MNIKLLLSITMMLILIPSIGCNSKTYRGDNPVFEKYHSKLKSIQPGFHMLGSNNNVYKLKYVGEPNSTIDSAKEIWLKRAKQICINSENIALTTDQKISESKSIKYKKMDGDITNTLCIIGGFTGCLIAEIILTDTITVKDVKNIKYPEIEGTIDCIPKQIESNK